MRLVILGAGESGVGTALLGQKEGYKFLYKMKSIGNNNSIPKVKF